MPAKPCAITTTGRGPGPSPVKCHALRSAAGVECRFAISSFRSRGHRGRDRYYGPPDARGNLLGADVVLVVEVVHLLGVPRRSVQCPSAVSGRRRSPAASRRPAGAWRPTAWRPARVWHSTNRNSVRMACAKPMNTRLSIPGWNIPLVQRNLIAGCAEKVRVENGKVMLYPVA